MYKHFFGLSELPFSISPDPKYLYMSKSHGEAIAHINYGIEAGEGFILLTGKAGTGKTTISRCLLQSLRTEIEVAYILNSLLNERDLLAAICDEFQLIYPDNAGIKCLFNQINDHLLANLTAGKCTLILVDEAQNLQPEVLEQLRLLTNIETNEKKLLQVILVGQLNQQQILGQPQLSQRITTHYHLHTLSRYDVDAYVRFRLQVAGCIQPIFTPRAITSLHRLSRGIPRLINLICDRALISAFARGSYKIIHNDITQAAFEVNGVHDEGSWQSSLLFTILGALLIITGWWGWQWIGIFPTRPIVRVEVPIIIDEIDEQQMQLNKAISQAIDSNKAMHSLYEIWGYETESLDANCNNASRAGLRCLSGEANLDELRSWQHPAMITLSDQSGNLYYATLASLKGNKANLIIGNQSWQVELEWLKSHWNSQYTLLWRMPKGNGYLITNHAPLTQIQWLENVLNRIKHQPNRKVHSFDNELKKKLIQFQQDQGLKADGIAGSKTLLKLNVLSGEAMPKLEEKI
ncbi:MAG: ExeA family protein [Plesiomonas shigelloides]